jgi:hypothetical protein
MIDHATVKLAELLDGLKLQGMALLPQALPVQQAVDFGARVGPLEALWRDRDRNGLLDNEEQLSLKVGTIHLQALMTEASGRAFALDLFQALTVGKAWRLFRRVFGDDVAFPLRLCTIRWHRPPFADSPTPLHQDVGFVGSDFPIINCWLTLTPAGGDAAGLEIEPVKLTRELPKHGDPRRASNFNFWSIEIDQNAARDQLGPLERVRPILQPGDAVLFDQFTPHRTWVDASMTQPRISVELRGCRASNHWPQDRFPDKLILTETREGVVVREFREQTLHELGRWDRT